MRTTFNLPRLASEVEPIEAVVARINAHLTAYVDGKPAADLLGDVLDFLVRVEEFVDGQADVVDDPPHEDGPSQSPNDAMRIQGDLQDNEGWDHGGRGLLTRVREAWQASK